MGLVCKDGGPKSKARRNNRRGQTWLYLARLQSNRGLRVEKSTLKNTLCRLRVSSITGPSHHSRRRGRKQRFWWDLDYRQRWTSTINGIPTHWTRPNRGPRWNQSSYSCPWWNNVNQTIVMRITLLHIKITIITSHTYSFNWRYMPCREKRILWTCAATISASFTYYIYRP